MEKARRVVEEAKKSAGEALKDVARVGSKVINGGRR